MPRGLQANYKHNIFRIETCDDASNLDLSKRRAASVKNELVTKLSCDASKFETDGKGESEPIADNSTSVNKAKNRRVEFINIKSPPATATSSKVK